MTLEIDTKTVKFCIGRGFDRRSYFLFYSHFQNIFFSVTIFEKLQNFNSKPKIMFIRSLDVIKIRMFNF